MTKELMFLVTEKSKLTLCIIFQKASSCPVPFYDRLQKKFLFLITIILLFNLCGKQVLINALTPRGIISDLGRYSESTISLINHTLATKYTYSQSHFDYFN